MQPMLSRLTKRFVVLVLAVLGAGVMLACAAQAAELVMFRRDGCPWCAKWDREIGPIYPKTEFNIRAPLRHVNLDHDRDVGLVHAPIHYTPTFVLAEGGKEVGRIEGYPGDTFFWPRLESLLERTPMPPASKDTPVSSATPIALKVGR